jgi:hypothetical protein
MLGSCDKMRPSVEVAARAFAPHPGSVGGAPLSAFGRGTLSGAIMRIVVFEVLGDRRYWGRGGCQAHFFCFVQKKGQGCHTVGVCLDIASSMIRL